MPTGSCTRVQVRVGRPHFVLVTACPPGGRAPDGVPPASAASSPPTPLSSSLCPQTNRVSRHLGLGPTPLWGGKHRGLSRAPSGWVFTNLCLTPVRLRHPNIPAPSLDGVTVLLLCQDYAAQGDLKPASPDSHGGRQLLGSLGRRPRTRVSTSPWTWPGCPDPPAATGPGDRPVGAGSLGDSAPGCFGEQSESSL